MEVAVSIASLTVQLAHSFQKLHNFWSSFKDAPSDIDSLGRDLEGLLAVLESIRIQQQGYNASPEVSTSLECCFQNVNVLLGIVEELEPGLRAASRRTRKWSALKTALNRDKFDRFKASLLDAKMTLLLAQSSLSGWEDSLRNRLCAQADVASSSRADRSSHQEVNVFSRGVRGSSLAEHGLNLDAEIRKVAKQTITDPLLQSWLESAVRRAVQDAFEGFTVQADIRTGALHSQYEHQHVPRKPPEDRGTYTKEEGTSVTLTSPKTPIISTRPDSCQRRTGSRTSRCWHSHISQTENLLGKICVAFRVSHSEFCSSEAVDDRLDEEDKEFETTIKIHPARWLLRFCINRGLAFSYMQSTRGWDFKLESFRAVPDDSQIFKLCQLNDVHGVKKLLTTGQASPWDTDSSGHTPLHFASAMHNVELCKLLIGEGAHQRAVADVLEYPRGLSPLLCAFLPTKCRTAPLLGPDRRMDILRIFLGEAELEEAWRVMFDVNLRSWLCVTPYEDGDVLMRLIKHVQEEIAYRTSDQDLDAITHAAPSDMRECARVLRNTTSDTAMSASLSPGDSVLHSHMNHMHSQNSQNAPARALIREQKADLALLHQQTSWATRSYGINFCTPTSIVIHNSLAFTRWRIVLEELGFNLESFVKEELQSRPLGAEGWAEDTLFNLFTWKFKPVAPARYQCSLCTRWAHDLEQTWWKGKLQAIKERRDPDAVPYPPLREIYDELFGHSCWISKSERSVCEDCAEALGEKSSILDSSSETFEDSPFLLSL